jgi:Flp pilus assembly protein TadG
MIGFAALSVDVGYVLMTKAQLQNAADSAAMAGVSGLTSRAYLEGLITPYEVVQLCRISRK